MIKINLLPWREELREERKRQFISTLVGCVVIAGGLVYLAGEYFDERIKHQNERNEYVRSEIKVLDERVKEIKELKARKLQLVERMKVIQDLQGNRPIAARLFDQMIRTLPDGVYFTHAKFEKNILSIDGAAESNSLVSNLMRNMDDSDWLANPVLDQVKATTSGQLDQANEFKLAVKQTKPKVVSDEEGASQ